MENKYGLSLIVPIGIENNENIQALYRLESLIILYNCSKLYNTELIVSECGSNSYFKNEIKDLCNKYDIIYTSANQKIFLSGLARNQGSLIAKYKFLGFIDIDLRFSTNLFLRIFKKIKQLQMDKKKNIFFTIPVFYLNKDFSVRLLNSKNSDYEINNLANEYFNHNEKTKVEYYSHVSSFIVVNKHHFYSIGGNDLDYKGHGFEDFDLLYRLIYEEGIIPKPTNHLIDKRSWNFNSYDGLRSYFAIKSIYNNCLNDDIYTVHLWHERPKNTSFYKKNNNRIIYKSKFNNFDLSGKHPKPLSFRKNNCIFFGEENEIKNLKDILPFIGNIKLYSENQEYDLNNDFCFIHPIKDKYKENYCECKNIQKVNCYEIKEKSNFYNISFNNKEILKAYFINHNSIKIFYKFLFENNALNYSTTMNKKISIRLINKIKNIKYVNKKINLKNANNEIHISNIIISRHINSIKTSKIKIIFNRFRKNPYYFLKKLFKGNKMRHIFREYDIRGIFGTEISPSFTKALGFVLGKIMLGKNAKSASVGYDVRLSNKVLNNALIYGLNRAGIKVYSLGLVPTPLGYFSNYACEIDANIMITASHNPKEYNGFKITINKESFFAKELSDIYTEVANCIKDFDDKIEDSEYEELDIKTKYIEFLQKEFVHLKNANLNLAIDTASGAACKIVADILDTLNIKYAHYFSEFDGEFRAHEPDPTHEENLFAIKNELNFSNFSHTCYAPLYKNGYVKNTAALGFGFDGDADRVVCILKDKIIKGDELCYLFANDIKNPKILCEVKCSKIIFDKINELGTCTMCKTGHSNIKKAIKEQNIDLAAELSGHIFFNDRYYGYDDAIYSMLRIIELYLKNPDFIGVLNKLPKSYSSDEIKIKVNEEDKFKIINKYKENIKTLNLNAKLIEIDGVRLEFENGFSLLRASNTSPYLIARFEANSKEELEKLTENTMKLLKNIV